MPEAVHSARMGQVCSRLLSWCNVNTLTRDEEVLDSSQLEQLIVREANEDEN